MSEFRDLVVALRSFSNRLTTVEECMVELGRNSKQEQEWRHEQRNRAMIEEARVTEQEAAFKQVQDFMGDLNDRFKELRDRFDNFVATRWTDLKGLNARVRRIEERLGEEEITKP